MKRKLLIIARLLVAAAGIGYIVYSLTWVDRVELPAGYRVGDRTLAEPAAWKVVAQDGQTLTLEAPDGVEPGSVQVSRSSLDAGPDGLVFRPGIVTTLRDADVGKLLIGFVLIGLIFPIQAMRWLILMRCRGMDVGAGKTFRLTMVGLFFNFCMPGMTGGDVAKAYYAAKGSGRRGAAVMSVIFDRVTGLVGLVVLVAVVGLFMFDNELVRRITVLTWIGLAGLGVGAWLYFSSVVRRVLGVDRLIGRLSENNPLVRIDHAAVAYRRHKLAVSAAVAMSVLVHLCQSGATALAGWALGMQASAVMSLVLIPVVFMAGAIPISYQGIGVMEWVGMQLLAGPGYATANQIVGMFMLQRVFAVTYALLGSLVLLRGDIHLHPQADGAEDAPGDAAGAGV